MGVVRVGGSFVKIPGICEVFVRPGISNYVSDILWGNRLGWKPNIAGYL